MINDDTSSSERSVGSKERADFSGVTRRARSRERFQIVECLGFLRLGAGSELGPVRPLLEAGKQGLHQFWSN